jgi:hypothetical protein
MEMIGFKEPAIDSRHVVAEPHRCASWDDHLLKSGIRYHDGAECDGRLFGHQCPELGLVHHGASQLCLTHQGLHLCRNRRFLSCRKPP